jgi:hypothetical protein
METFAVGGSGRVSAAGISQTGRDALADGFVNPPQEARLRCYWWWLNGNTS